MLITISRFNSHTHSNLNGYVLCRVAYETTLRARLIISRYTYGLYERITNNLKYHQSVMVMDCVLLMALIFSEP